jgi:hypothetical protein
MQIKQLIEKLQNIANESPDVEVEINELTLQRRLRLLKSGYRPEGVGYISIMDKYTKADSIKSLEDWNKLSSSVKLEMFEIKFPAAWPEMPKMYSEHKEKYPGNCYASDWYQTMMQKFVEIYLPAKSLP